MLLQSDAATVSASFSNVVLPCALIANMKKATPENLFGSSMFSVEQIPKVSVENSDEPCIGLVFANAKYSIPYGHVQFAITLVDFLCLQNTPGYAKITPNGTTLYVLNDKDEFVVSDKKLGALCSAGKTASLIEEHTCRYSSCYDFLANGFAKRQTPKALIKALESKRGDETAVCACVFVSVIFPKC